ncbi:hypothetical protein AYO44_17190 [Planctomycetaceae bacterium SCGC AG-212-F19]|nr:hypothetical protein AYO44_17190 [Planctomycetaceae bacterium SCGC AG-212-F19]
MRNAVSLMKRHWRLWFVLALLLFSGAALFVPAVHWRLIGLAKGEAFYQGRPTSWWVRDIEDYYIPVVEGESRVRGEPEDKWIDPSPVPVSWSRQPPPPWWAWRPAWWPSSGAVQFLTIEDAPLMRGDPTDLPLFLELVRRPEVKSRQVAVTGLATLASREPAALAALRAAADDGDPAVRRQVQQTLRQLGLGGAGIEPTP